MLSKNYTNAYTLYDYHDLASNPVQFYWKGYKAQYEGQTYCKEDFICGNEDLELKIGDKDVPILRGDLVILPESGPGYKIIFDDINSTEIVAILADLPNQTNLFFENIIVPNKKGDEVRLPLKFAFHLE